MKKLLFLLATFLVFSVSFAGKYTLPADGNTKTEALSKTFANSQVDTIIITRDKALNALTFAAQWDDTVSLISIVVFRSYKTTRYMTGAVAATNAELTVTADTLFSNHDANTTTVIYANTVSYGRVFEIALSPLADQYYVVVTYGATGNATDGKVVHYGALKQYGK